MRRESESGGRGDKGEYWCSGMEEAGGCHIPEGCCGQDSLVLWELWLSLCPARLHMLTSLCLSKLIMFSCVNYKKGVSGSTELCFHKHCLSDVCATTLEYDFILSLVITVNNLHNGH